MDDVLDYRGTADEIGKNVGDDLAEGKPTLPLIHAMRHGSPAQVALLRDAILHGRKEDIGDVVSAVESTGSITYTARAAEAEAAQARRALSGISDSRYRKALETLVEFSVSRNH